MLTETGHCAPSPLATDIYRGPARKQAAEHQTAPHASACQVTHQVDVLVSQGVLVAGRCRRISGLRPQVCSLLLLHDVHLGQNLPAIQRESTAHVALYLPWCAAEQPWSAGLTAGTSHCRMEQRQAMQQAHSQQIQHAPRRTGTEQEGGLQSKTGRVSPCLW